MLRLAWFTLNGHDNSNEFAIIDKRRLSEADTNQPI